GVKGALIGGSGRRSGGVRRAFLLTIPPRPSHNSTQCSQNLSSRFCDRGWVSSELLQARSTASPAHTLRRSRKRCGHPTPTVATRPQTILPRAGMILFGCLCLCLVLIGLAFRRQVGTALWDLRLRLFGVPVRAPARPVRPAPSRPVAVPWHGSVPPP